MSNNGYLSKNGYLSNKAYLFLVLDNSDSTNIHNNYFSNYKINEALTLGETKTIKTTIRPFNIGYIGVWSTNEELHNDIIEIEVRDSLVGTVSELDDSKQTITSKNVVKTYYSNQQSLIVNAYSQTGCSWSKKISFKESEFYSLRLKQDNSGTVKFWMNNDDYSHYGKMEITIMSNSKEEKTLINTGHEFSPNECNGEAVFNLPVGNHSYNILNVETGYSWSETFSVVKGCNPPIQIITPEKNIQ